MLANETFWELLKSPGHWYFELFLMFIFDVIIGLLLWPFVKRHIHMDLKRAGHKPHNGEESHQEEETDGIVR